MSRIRKSKMERFLPKLKEVARTATMNTADFDYRIKEITRLWRYSWIVDPLERIIKELEEEIKR